MFNNLYEESTIDYHASKIFDILTKSADDQEKLERLESLRRELFSQHNLLSSLMPIDSRQELEIELIRGRILDRYMFVKGIQLKILKRRLPGRLAQLRQDTLNELLNMSRKTGDRL